MSQDFAPGLITFSDDANIDFTSNMSAFAWVYADTLGAGASGARNVIRKTANYTLRLDDSTRRPMALWFDNTNIRQRIYGSTHSTSAWHSYLMVVTSNDISALYIDGTDGGTTSTLIPFARDLTNPLLVGGLTASTENWDGKIAEVALGDAALTAAEATALNAGYSPLLIRPASLKFYAPLVRHTNDIRTGLAGTASGTVAADVHPRIIMPSVQNFRYGTTAAGGGLAANPLYGGGAAANPLYGMVA